MAPGFTVRDYSEADYADVAQLYPIAFPWEDLLPLVRQLVGHDDATHLICDEGGTVAGHLALTQCAISDEPASASLLGPLAVHPEYQQSGIGSALVRAGITAMKETGSAAVFVLGDPAYYGRFGFLPERNIAPPYALPDEWADAWQSLKLIDEPIPAGTLRVPEPWQPKALWLP